MHLSKRLTLNQKLAAVVLVLGVIAVGARPYAGTVVTLDTRALALEVTREADHVEPLDLAGWIIAGRGGYRLVDIRTPKDFAEYHVPTAELVPLPELMDAALGRDETIVIYSAGGIHAAQAWMLLKARGYKAVYMLRGGLDGWKDQVLFPALAEHPSPYQAARDAKLKAISAHFGGTPQSGTAGGPGSPVPRVLPKVDSSPAPAPTDQAPARKTKEGC